MINADVSSAKTIFHCVGISIDSNHTDAVHWNCGWNRCNKLIEWTRRSSIDLVVVSFMAAKIALDLGSIKKIDQIIALHFDRFDPSPGTLLV